MDNYQYIDEDFGFEEKPTKAKPPRIKDVDELGLYKDKDFLVLNKPPLVSTLDERAEGFGKGLLRLVKEQYPSAQAAHRLDKETSGVIAFALNSAAYRHLAMQFEHRQVTKIYHAVVNGIHSFEGIRVYLPILPMNGGYVIIDKEHGKEAETIFNTLENFRNCSLIECIPITGRTHQIRIHLSCLKASIVMDSRYGGKPVFLSQIKRKFNIMKDTVEQPLIQRIALHAKELNFELMNGERLHVEAPYPKDMDALLTQVRKFS